MQYDEFVGQVQNKARLASNGEAVRAIRATLETLGERLYGGQPEHIAAQLPQEIGIFLETADGGKDYTVQEFLENVAEKENVDYPEAVHHARAVMATVEDAVSTGEIEDMRNQLPEEYDALFEAGSEGEMNIPD